MLLDVAEKYGPPAGYAWTNACDKYNELKQKRATPYPLRSLRRRFWRLADPDSMSKLFEIKIIYDLTIQ